MKTFIVFLFVGGVSALVYFGLLAALLEVVHIDYRAAVSIAYISSVLCHFLANRNLTFKANGAGLLKQVSRYLPMVALNYLLTISIVAIAVEICGYGPYFGAVAAIGITTGLSFVISKMWVFKRESLGE